MDYGKKPVRQVAGPSVRRGPSSGNYRLLHAGYFDLSRCSGRGHPAAVNEGVSGFGHFWWKPVTFGLALKHLSATFLELKQVGKICYRYLLTRLDNNEPTVASLEQTIEDIKAVLAASNVPIPEGLAELHQSGTFKIVNDVQTGKIETILMARAECADASDPSRAREVI